MTFKFKDNRKAWDRMQSSVRATKAYVAWGWPEEKSSNHGAITNAALGVIHEFGAQRHDAESTVMAAAGVNRQRARDILDDAGVGIPARAPLRTAWDTNRETYVRMFNKGLADLLAGKGSVFTVLERVGIRGAADVKNAIREGLEPPLAPSTLKRRKSEGADTPLVKTGQFLNSITSVVRGAKR